MKTRAFSLTILIAVVLCLWIDKTFGQPFPNTPAIQLGRGFIGHIAYSPDGKILATAGSTLWLYNADDLTEITPLKGHTDFINTVTFSLDGQFLASASNDGTVRLWDTASYHQVAILPHQHPVLSVAVSPDGTLLASTRKKSVLLWAIPAQQEVGRLEGHIATVNDIAFSPDGIRLVSGSNDTTVRTGDVSTGEEIGRLVHLAKLLFSVNARIVGDLMPDSDLPDALRREFENNGVFLPETATVHFEPLSRDPESEPFWWVADDEGFYTILQEKDTLSVHSGYPGRVSDVAISPDGKLIGSAGGQHPGGLTLWNMETQEQAAAFTSFYGSSLVAFSPDGKTVASGGGFPTGLRLIDVSSQQVVGETEYAYGPIAFHPDGRIAFSTGFRVHAGLTGIVHSGKVSGLFFGSDGQTLFSAGGEWGPIQLWSLATQEPQSYVLPEVGPVIMSEKVLISENENVIRIWDIESKEFIGEVGEVQSRIVEFEISSNRKICAFELSSSPSRIIQLWDIERQQSLGKLPAEGDIHRFAISPNGQILASIGDFEGFVQQNVIIELWDVKTQERIGELVGHIHSIQNLVFDPTGRLLVSISSGEIYIWDVASQQLVKVLSGHTPVAFSSNGKVLAYAAFVPVVVGEDEYEAVLWNIESEEQMAKLVGHRGHIGAIAFSQDGKWIATGGSDGTILLWEFSATSAWDVNADGTIDVFDLILVGSHFGQTGIGLTGDVNGDGTVNILDLVVVGSHFGETATAAPKAFVPSAPQTQAAIQRALTELEAMDNPPDGALVAIKFLRTWLSGANQRIRETELLQNYPNPFNPETWFPFALNIRSDVEIQIYSANGNLVRTLRLGEKVPGIYRSKQQAAYWDGNNDTGEAVSSGVYFYKLRVEEEVFVRKAMLLK